MAAIIIKKDINVNLSAQSAQSAQPAQQHAALCVTLLTS